MDRILLPFAAAVALLASGCVSIYSEPSTASQTARLRVSQLARGGQTLVQELPGACQPSHSSDTGYRKIAMLAGRYTQVQPHLRKKLGIPDAPLDEGDFTEVHIPAGSPFYFRVSRSESNAYQVVRTVETYCDAAISFTPENGADYEAVSSRRSGGCGLTVNKLVSSAGKVSRIEVPTTRIEAFCK